MARRFIDGCSEDGSHRLCAIIRTYWEHHGRRVTVEPCLIECMAKWRSGATYTNHVWGIRSNLGMYVPPASDALQYRVGR
jgi:hypothetical protein